MYIEPDLHHSAILAEKESSCRYKERLIQLIRNRIKLQVKILLKVQLG